MAQTSVCLLSVCYFGALLASLAESESNSIPDGISPGHGYIDLGPGTLLPPNVPRWRERDTRPATFKPQTVPRWRERDTRPATFKPQTVPRWRYEDQELAKLGIGQIITTEKPKEAPTRLNNFVKHWKVSIGVTGGIMLLTVVSLFLRLHNANKKKTNNTRRGNVETVDDRAHLDPHAFIPHII